MQAESAVAQVRLDLGECGVVAELDRWRHSQAGTGHLFAPGERQTIAVELNTSGQHIVVVLKTIDQFTIGGEDLQSQRNGCAEAGQLNREICNSLDLINAPNNRGADQRIECKIAMHKGIASIEMLIANGARQQRGAAIERGIAGLTALQSLCMNQMDVVIKSDHRK